MSRRRKTHRNLTESRIYQKRNKYYLFSAEAIVNPDTNKKSKWHSLCNISEGEHKARLLAKRINDYNRQSGDEGNMPRLLRSWISDELNKREKKRPDDPMKIKMFESRNRDLISITEVIARTFAEFNVDQVIPVDVAQFLDRWEGRRMAQVYRNHLSKFFQWSCRKGFRMDNPAREIKTDMPPKRDIYITHEQFNAIRDALMVGNNGKENITGVMMQCYMDLCYLLYQRTTDVRLLKFQEIKPEGIYIKPTKTDHSSGGDVLIPMTEGIETVLNRAKNAQKIQSAYVICTLKGRPYTASGLRSAWKRACSRVGIKGLTLKDLRSKAATDASLAGNSLKDLATGMVHTDTGTTKDYIRVHETPVSSVSLSLPPKS